MARPLRIEYPGAVYHVTSRGNEKRPVYKDEEDRQTFLNIIRHVNKRYNFICHAYCLMNNHYHLLIETPDGNLSTGMRQLNGVYTQLFNNRYSRCGHLFQGRYKAILIQKDSHLLEVCRYVVLNPVRAKIVNDPLDWKWSSYRATSGIDKPHSCLSIDWVLKQFGSKEKWAKQEYRKFVGDGIGQKSIWSDVKGQVLLGGSEFLKSLMEYLKKSEDIAEIPCVQRRLDRPSLEHLFELEIKDKEIRNKKIIEAVEQYGYSQCQVADHLGLHYATLSRLVNR